MRTINPRYAIGIDLGTTNSALAFIDLGASTAKPQILSVPQWESDGSVVSAATLPSFLYLPPKSEWKKGQLALPQQQPGVVPDYAVGRFARWQASQQPGRVIHQAKSWLCHQGVDREERILPWQVGDLIGEERRSPVEVPAAYLRHLKEAWNLLMAQDDPECRFEHQKVIITVPASFDEAAQRLTLKAAELAGYPLPHVRLLEEPQAAFYHWLSLGQKLPQTKPFNVLICDIGGGTTDFSLFRVEPRGPERPEVRRLSVSDHLLLGGDNFDLSLAHLLEAKLAGPHTRLSSRQWAQLIFATRQLKEAALNVADESPADEELFVSIAGEGASLLASAKTASIKRQEIIDHILGGFFPYVDSTDRPIKQKIGLTSLGLPFAQDSAITRHLAQFIAHQHVDAVLFNGGSLKPPMLRRVLVEQIAAWQGGIEPSILTTTDSSGADLDLAVAYGAAHYAALRVRSSDLIKGGYARSVYVEVESTDQEHSTSGPRTKLVCLVPKGYDGISALKIEGLELKLRTDRPVRFQLFTANHRDNDKLGDVVFGENDEFHALPPLHTNIGRDHGKLPELLNVQVEANIAETGLLSLELVATDSGKMGKKWQLDFNIRATRDRRLSALDDTATEVTIPNEKRALVSQKLLDAYGKKRQTDSATVAKNLVKEFENILGLPREEWDSVFLRGLWTEIANGMTRRGRSLGHEAQWLYLAGYCLRPGYGCAADEWRTQELWQCFQHGPFFPKEKQAVEQWWIMWRRVAGGLHKEQQELLFDRIFPAIRKGDASPEIYLLAGSLERIDMTSKIRLGQHLTQYIADGRQQFINQRMWALARIASRVPLYSGAHNIVRPETVVEWFNELQRLKRGEAAYSKLPLFLSLAGRMIGDREYDLADVDRGRFLAKLGEAGATPEQMRLVRELVPMDHEAKSQLFGEALPSGLVL